MGRAVAAALGATTRRTGYLEGTSDLVTWCVGHLVELDAPEAYNPAWKQWRLADLPLCPAPFTYHPAEPTRDQFNVIKQLLVHLHRSFYVKGSLVVYLSYETTSLYSTLDR